MHGALRKQSTASKMGRISKIKCILPYIPSMYLSICDYVWSAIPMVVHPKSLSNTAQFLYETTINSFTKHIFKRNDRLVKTTDSYATVIGDDSSTATPPVDCYERAHWIYWFLSVLTFTHCTKRLRQWFKALLFAFWTKSRRKFAFSQRIDAVPTGLPFVLENFRTRVRTYPNANLRRVRIFSRSRDFKENVISSLLTV